MQLLFLNTSTKIPGTCEEILDTAMDLERIITYCVTVPISPARISLMNLPKPGLKECYTMDIIQDF